MAVVVCPVVVEAVLDELAAVTALLAVLFVVVLAVLLPPEAAVPPDWAAFGL